MNEPRKSGAPLRDCRESPGFFVAFFLLCLAFALASFMAVSFVIDGRITHHERLA